MLSRRIVLSVVTVLALVLSSAGSAEACLFGGCGCHSRCCGGFLRGLFRHHGCCTSDCGCGCESSCDSGCGCGSGCDGGCDSGCGCGDATEESSDAAPAPAAPEAAPAAPSA